MRLLAMGSVKSGLLNKHYWFSTHLTAAIPVVAAVFWRLVDRQSCVFICKSSCALLRRAGASCFVAYSPARAAMR